MTRRVKLTNDRILRAAVTLVEEGGLDALSMRNLAELLGAGTMSLYNHVASKEEILDGILELAAGEIHAPRSGTDWRQSMRQRAISMREMILRHPWAGRLLESRTQLGPRRLRLLDASLGCLRHGGFSVEGAARALLLVDCYIYGFTLQEVAGRFASASPAEAAEALRPQAEASALPHLTELVLHLTSGASGDAFRSLPLEFETGLDLILEAMERLRRAD